MSTITFQHYQLYQLFFNKQMDTFSAVPLSQRKKKASGKAHPLPGSDHLKREMTDSCGYHGTPVRSARGQLCLSTVSATKMEISTARHGAEPCSLLCRAADLLQTGCLDTGAYQAWDFCLDMLCLSHFECGVRW